MNKTKIIIIILASALACWLWIDYSANIEYFAKVKNAIEEEILTKESSNHEPQIDSSAPISKENSNTVDQSLEEYSQFIKLLDELYVAFTKESFAKSHILSQQLQKLKSAQKFSAEISEIQNGCHELEKLTTNQIFPDKILNGLLSKIIVIKYVPAEEKQILVQRVEANINFIRSKIYLPKKKI